MPIGSKQAKKYTANMLVQLRQLHPLIGISTIKTSQLGIAILIFAILVLSSI